MKTQKELLEKHRAELDAKFRAKYPKGKFCLEQTEAWLSYRATFGLYWEPRRPTSHSRYKGIAVKISLPDNVQHSNFANMAVCGPFKRNDYDTLEKLLTRCKKVGVPKQLVDAFVKRYNARQSEGFDI